MQLRSVLRSGGPTVKTRAVALAFSVLVGVSCLFQINPGLPSPRSPISYAAIGLILAQIVVIFVRKRGTWLGSVLIGPLVAVAAQGFVIQPVTVALALAALAAPLMFASRAMAAARIASVAITLPILSIFGAEVLGQTSPAPSAMLIPTLVVATFGALMRIALNASVVQEESGLRESLLAAISTARDEALATSRAKGAFLGTMSHELRTPLNAVIGLADLVLATPLDAQQQDLVRTISVSGENLLRIIDDILDFSQIEAGQVGLSERPFDLRVLVEDTVESFAPARARLGLTHAFDDDVHAAVIGDPDRLKKILTHLIDNAIKFTYDGYVIVRIKKVTPITTTEGLGDTQTVMFEIVDTGMGIAPGHIEQLMEPFDQLHTSTTRAYGGAGLGLALCRALTLAMGATLTVESTEDEGSTFTVTITLKQDPAPRAPVEPVEPVAPVASDLPAEPETAEKPDEPGSLTTVSLTTDSLTVSSLMTSSLTDSPPETPDQPEAVPEHNLRVLLVEDDEINQKVGSLILTKLGYPFEIANNGHLAVAAAELAHYDVILMDMRMPEMDGLEATRQIRALLPPDRQPMIVALTANVTQGDRLACAEAGMDGFLSKPVRSLDVEALLADQEIVLRMKAKEQFS